MKRPARCGLDKATWFRNQIAPTLATLEEELARRPDSPRALALAVILADLAGGEVPIPPLVSAAAAKRGRGTRRLDGALTHLLWTLWDGLEGQRALTAERAEALARPLIRSLRDPLSLLRLKRKCVPFRHVLPASLFDRAICRRAPRYLEELPTLKIDRAFLEGIMTPEEAQRVTLGFHPDGGLRRLASRRSRASLTLDPVPGSGRFVEEGKRGGSGFLTQEHYRDGGVSGTFNSPWHDGEEYTEKIDWPLWVAEAVRSVVAA